MLVQPKFLCFIALGLPSKFSSLKPFIINLQHGNMIVRTNQHSLRTAFKQNPTAKVDFDQANISLCYKHFSSAHMPTRIPCIYCVKGTEKKKKVQLQSNSNVAESKTKHKIYLQLASGSGQRADNKSLCHVNNDIINLVTCVYTMHIYLHISPHTHTHTHTHMQPHCWLVPFQ